MICVEIRRWTGSESALLMRCCHLEVVSDCHLEVVSDCHYYHRLLVGGISIFSAMSPRPSAQQKQSGSGRGTLLGHDTCTLDSILCIGYKPVLSHRTRSQMLATFFNK